MSNSDSEEGALPVGVSGGDSSWSAARFISGVSIKKWEHRVGLIA